jgi:hypothetical protein
VTPGGRCRRTPEQRGIDKRNIACLTADRAVVLVTHDKSPLPLGACSWRHSSGSLGGVKIGLGVIAAQQNSRGGSVWLPSRIDVIRQ